MNEYLTAIIVSVALILSIYFFYKVSGSLNPGKLNLISVTALLFYLQSFIGIVLIMFGLDKHYTLTRLFDKDNSIRTTFFVVMAFSIVFPLIMYFVLRLFKVNAKKEYATYLQNKTEYYDSKVLFWLVVIAGAVCLGLLVQLIIEIGYVPLIKMFFHEETFAMELERTRNAGITVINQYITNIMIHLAIPVIAYFSFSCAIASKKTKWWILAVIFFAASIITKTYNFSKAPIVFFILVYVFIIIYHYGGIKMRWMFLAGGVGFIVLFIAYSLLGTKLDLTDIYNGIWGRTLFTQVGTLSYNFDLFPNYILHLNGRSFGQILLPLFGLSASDHVRSARILMEVYGSAGVYDGSAGVMNSLFIGEAYANFGWVGLIFSVIWVALLITAFYVLILKLKKTPATVTLFAYFTVNMATATQGGFVDFVYSASWIIVFAALLVCHKFFTGIKRKKELVQEHVE